jgi:hypothetical protein
MKIAILEIGGLFLLRILKVKPYSAWWCGITQSPEITL